MLGKDQRKQHREAEQRAATEQERHAQANGDQQPPPAPPKAQRRRRVAKSKPTPASSQVVPAKTKAARRLSRGKAKAGHAPEGDKESVVTSMADIDEQVVEWLWRGWIAMGKLHIIDGDPGKGNSSIVFDIIARLSRGGQLPNGASTIPRRMLIMSGEDDIADTIKPALRAAKAEMANIFTLKLRSDEDGNRIPFTVPDDIPRLEKAIDEKGVDLVLLDPIMGFLSEHINSHNDASARRALEPLAHVAGERHCAVIGIRHLNKDDRVKNPLYRGGGSIAVTGQARIVLIVDSPPFSTTGDPMRVLAVTKNNLVRRLSVPSLRFEVTEWSENPEIRVVEWHGETPVSAEDLMRGRDARKDDHARREAKRVLSEILQDGPMASKEMYTDAADAGISKSTARRALEAMEVHSYRIRDDAGKTKGWFTHLAEQPCPEDCHCVRVAMPKD